MHILELCSVIVMVTPVTIEDKFQENGDLIYAGEYLDIVGTTKMRLELADTLEFENTLNKRIEELNLKLKESNNIRESDILINEIDTLESILGRLTDLKYGDKARVIEIAEANNNYQQANRLRKQLIKIQDTEDEISAQIQNWS